MEFAPVPRHDDQCFQPILNQSGNQPFAAILNRRISLSPGSSSNVVIRWGDPVVLGAPGCSLDGQTAESSAKQFGFNGDYNGFLPLYPGASERGTLVVNHEYTGGNEMFPGY